MTVLIVVLTSLFTIIFVVIGLPIFIIWMIRNSVQAAKYRQSLVTVSQIKTGYQLVYKSGRKTETIDLIGDTETEAMKDLISKGIRYDKIISLTKR